MNEDIRERIMQWADKMNISPPAGYASSNAFLSALVPVQPFPPLPQPIPYEVIWKQVEDVGHEEDAYYKLVYRCISRHGQHALLCRELGIDADKSLEFLVMVGK
jgi:hypothetical protein